MITIYFNAKPIKICKDQSLLTFLSDKACYEEYYAVALNRQFIPREKLSDIILKENDRVEMITPMQGG